jgi:hypothetical protein
MDIQKMVNHGINFRPNLIELYNSNLRQQSKTPEFIVSASEKLLENLSSNFFETFSKTIFQHDVPPTIANAVLKIFAMESVEELSGNGENRFEEQMRLEGGVLAVDNFLDGNGIFTGMVEAYQHFLNAFKKSEIHPKTENFTRIVNFSLNMVFYGVIVIGTRLEEVFGNEECPCNNCTQQRQEKNLTFPKNGNKMPPTVN